MSCLQAAGESLVLLIKATDTLAFPHIDCLTCSFIPPLKTLSDSEVLTRVNTLIDQPIPDVERVLNLLVTTAKISDTLDTTTQNNFLVCVCVCVCVCASF